jgi:8-oxo-dGTP diphosphatase
MSRTIRYQGAIVHDHHLLLIQHRHHADGRSYWLMPGGGREADETEEDCVRREMREETGLDVQVMSLLFDAPDYPGGVYQRLKTYLCHILGGQAAPGYEPEAEAAQEYAIAAVKWFDLRDHHTWEPEVWQDPLTSSTVQQIRAALGYPAAE